MVRGGNGAEGMKVVIIVFVICSSSNSNAGSQALLSIAIQIKASLTFFRKTCVILDDFIHIGVLHSPRNYFFISLKFTQHKPYKWSPGYKKEEIAAETYDTI